MDTAKVNPQYAVLHDVLMSAFKQASEGKGKERHACSRSFEEQPMQTISELVGSNHGLIYQAIKKAQESIRMPTNRAVAELYGAINYLAGAIIYLENQDPALVPRASRLKDTVDFDGMSIAHSRTGEYP